MIFGSGFLPGLLFRYAQSAVIRAVCVVEGFKIEIVEISPDSIMPS